MPKYFVGGQELHTTEAGPANRQKAILIHGWSSSSYAMSPLLKLLSQRFQAVAVDLPGYGASPPLSRQVSIPAYADLMAEFAEQISDGPVVLVGHSMGGMIALNVALNYPLLVERLVLIAPTISGRLSNTINLFISPVTLMERFGLGQALVAILERAFVGVTDRLMRPVSFADRSDITEEEYLQLRADARRPGQGQVRAECFFAMRDNDLSARLKDVQVPTLVIWGAEDNTVPLRDAGIIADEWPGADLRILPKAGHWPHFESPQVTRRLVAAYLGLPRLSDNLDRPPGDRTLVGIRDVAQFLAHSTLGGSLNLLQRTRLAGQLDQRRFPPYRRIVNPQRDNYEMFIVQRGTVEVWAVPEEAQRGVEQPRLLASLKPGEMTGELSMIDKGERTAELVSGPEGATVLTLTRERMLALAEDDPELGNQLMWNLLQALTRRVRFILWQLDRARQRQQAEQAQWEQEMAEREQASQSGMK